MRKYATAFTRAGTLSFVITSWGGMFSVIVRRSTFTIRSTIGIRMKRPGPFGCGSSRPSRNTIPRSYSRAPLIALIANSKTKKTTTARTTRAALTVESLDGAHFQGKPVELLDLHVLARAERLRRLRLPQLAAHEDEAGLADDAFHSDELVRADARRASTERD